MGHFRRLDIGAVVRNRYQCCNVGVPPLAVGYNVYPSPAPCSYRWSPSYRMIVDETNMAFVQHSWDNINVGYRRKPIIGRSSFENFDFTLQLPISASWWSAAAAAAADPQSPTPLS